MSGTKNRNWKTRKKPSVLFFRSIAEDLGIPVVNSTGIPRTKRSLIREIERTKKNPNCKPRFENNPNPKSYIRRNHGFGSIRKLAEARGISLTAPWKKKNGDIIQKPKSRVRLRRELPKLCKQRSHPRRHSSECLLGWLSTNNPKQP